MPSVAAPSIPFQDPASGRRNILLLQESFATAGSVYGIDEFMAAIEGRLSQSPDPDLSLVNLVRFVEATFNKATLFNDVLKYPAYLDLLLRVFGTSRYLADILVREPELFRWLTASDAIETLLDPISLRRELARIPELFGRTERRLDAIKRVHRREILRIGVQDIMAVATVETVTRELADLADAVAEGVLQLAYAQIADRFPVPPPARFVVLGLGKLGGRELNYSSDIDLLVVYDVEGVMVDRQGTECTHHEYFNRLAELFVRLLSQSSPEGSLYRVDMRLRPESGAGPLARSLLGYLTYYESRGELWERQMLIKARPIAGHSALGDEFLKQVQPFIYPRTAFQHPADAIARIKARIEAKVGAEANIKLMPGGIRDIEFVVQALQLINGGKHLRLRTQGTLPALRLLREEDLLSPSETEALEAAYIFFRTVEHRLQILQNTQTHTLPAEQASIASLARRLGMDDAAGFTRHLDHHLHAVRRIFDQVMAFRPQGKEAGIQALIDGDLGDAESATMLGGYGFHDTRSALRSIKALSGTNLTGQRDMDARGRNAFRTIAPVIFQQIGATRHPDLTLRNLATLVQAQVSPAQIYSALAEPHFQKMILEVCAASPYLVRGLASSPLLLESVMADVASLATARSPGLPRKGDIIGHKQLEEIRIGLRYVLGFAGLPEMTADLTALAETVLNATFTAAQRKFRLRQAPLAVFGLGKLGTRELNFGSDLDVLLVSSDLSPDRQSVLEEMASSMIQHLTSVSPKGRLYDIDARLRPEGRNAPLVVQEQAYGEYLARRATLWERQSLTRLRLLCGDKSLGERVTSMVERFVYEEPLPQGWAGQIAAMRRKMESRSRFPGSTYVDIKLGPGGLADAEFLVQMIQLRHGGMRPELRSGSVAGLLASPALPVLEPSQRVTLGDSYAFLRRIETLLRLTLEEHTSLLPEGERLETLARCMGYEQGPALIGAVRGQMDAVRSLFTNTVARMDTTP